MKISDEILTEMSYIKISKYRTEVMKILKDEVKIPTEIAEESGIRRNHVSNVLTKLREHELVECINPDVKKGRLYRLTDKGEEVVKNL